MGLVSRGASQEWGHTEQLRVRCPWMGLVSRGASQDWGPHMQQPFGGGSHGKFWVLGAGETGIVGLGYRVWEGC